MNEQQKRAVTAPHTGASDSSGQIISVELQPGEEVIWQWTHYPDGRSFITGYEIVQQSERSKH